MTDMHESPHALARRAREATGFSQERFARLLGVSAATVSAWEQGRRQPATQRLAHVLLRLIAARPEVCLQELGTPPPHQRRRKGGPAAQVLACCGELGRATSGRIPLDRLRAALPELDRTNLDQALLQLEQDGLVALVEPLFPSQLSEVERGCQLDHPSGYRVLFAELPQGD